MLIKDRWQRFYNYHKAIVIFFGISFVFTLVNEKMLLVPFELSGYFFWLSLGLYLGFRLCWYEYSRVRKLIEKEQEKKDGPFSSN